MEPVRKNKKCDICPYATNTNQNLKKHKKTHEKVTPLINDCWECDKTFTTKKSLTDHMRTHNKKDKSINCELCEFKTDRKFNLKLEKLSTIVWMVMRKSINTKLQEILVLMGTSERLFRATPASTLRELVLPTES